MRRRNFLTATASATALGLTGCVDRMNGDDANPETSAQDGPGSQPEGTGNGTETGTPETETPEETVTEGEETTAEEGTATEGRGTSSQAWGTSGRMDGVPYSFSSQSHEAGEQRDEADIRFDTDAGEVLVDGTISGSDSCKRATLGSLEYDESAGTLTVGVETTNIEDCDMAAQVVGSIDYEGTFEFDGDLPGEVTVSHNGQDIANATHESSRATVVPPTTDE